MLERFSATPYRLLIKWEHSNHSDYYAFPVVENALQKIVSEMNELYEVRVKRTKSYLWIVVKKKALILYE